MCINNTCFYVIIALYIYVLYCIYIQALISLSRAETSSKQPTGAQVREYILQRIHIHLNIYKCNYIFPDFYIFSPLVPQSGPEVHEPSGDAVVQESRAAVRSDQLQVCYEHVCVFVYIGDLMQYTFVSYHHVNIHSNMSPFSPSLSLPLSSNEIDMWSIGCLFAEMKAVPRAPLLPGKDDINQLELIYQLLGRHKISSIMCMILCVCECQG